MSSRALSCRERSSGEGLAAEVLRGLRRQPKRIAPIWFYDEAGSRLFDRICELPEYYVTRTELAIMRQHAVSIAQCLGRQVALIELGSGTSHKTRLLLGELDEPSAYVPVDICREHLAHAAAALARDYPHLAIVPLCLDFTRPWQLPLKLAALTRRVIYFPGSTLGNFEPDAACRLLVQLRTLMGADGAALIGIDLRKEPAVLERAYDDAAGVTAEFNRNALRHLNGALGCDFDPQAFEHRALWIEAHGRIEMHLVSRREQVVHLGAERIAFACGEPLHTEYCHKYTLEGFAALAAAAGLAVLRVWTDPQRQFSVQLLSPHADAERERC